MRKMKEMILENQLGNNCPNCNHPTFVSDDYCTKCGQKLY